MSTPAKPRLDLVDWLRLLAALQMVTGHTIDAVLVDTSRSGAMYEGWVQVRGLVAPAFLLASGMSFALAMRLEDEARFAAIRATDGARRRRVVRSAWLIVLGTLLHAADAPWIVDVLQCVGASLLALDLAVTVHRSPRGLLTTCAVLATGIFGVALAVHRSIGPSDHTGAERFLAAWVDPDGGSLFPLVPWAGYVFAGVVVARIVAPRGAATPSRVVLPRLVAVSAACAVGAAASEVLLGRPSAEDWSAHPSVVLSRIAGVLLVAAALGLVAARLRLARPLRTLAGETLALYVVHLSILFAHGVGPGRLWERSLSPPLALGLAAAVLAASVALALGWARWWPPLEAQWMPWLRPATRDRGSLA